jgi:hypothetical protein
MPKGKGVSILLGFGAPKRKGKDEGSSDKEDVAQELIDAVKANDAAGVVSAMEAMHSLCSSKMEDDEEEDESDDEKDW